MPHRYFIQLSYNGTHYHGWQCQDNSNTIQKVINTALSVILGGEIMVTGCGRTDAGVHARQFFAHFDLDYPIEMSKQIKLVFNLNGFLPQDIAVQRIFEVNPAFNARFSALSRTYAYHISIVKDPFTTDQAFRYTGPLDLSLMNEAALRLLNHSDFTSFAKMPFETKTNNCTVSEAHWNRIPDGIVFTISANRFLRNMVRAIVGTLLDIGRGRYQPNQIDEIILAKDRGRAGFSVPACGLYLIKVEYPLEIYAFQPQKGVL